MKLFLSGFIPLVFPHSFFYAFFLALGVFYSACGFSIWIFSCLVFSLFLGLLKFKPKDPFLYLILSCFFLGGVSFYYKKQALLNQKLQLGTCKATILEQIKTGNPHWPHRVRLTTPNGFHFFIYTKRISHIEKGDFIETPSLIIKKPKKSDFRNYLFKERIAGTVFVKSFKPIVIKKPYFSFARWTHYTTKRILSSLKQKMSRKTFTFFSSLFIGDKKSVKKTIETYALPFKKWGISHHLARSGLHLIIFIILWQILVSLLPLSFFLKTIITTLLSVVYFILTPWSISFVRAFQLFLFYKFCTLFNWQINPINILCVVFIVTLLYNPFQLFFLDFQLSFYCTFCLAWLAHLNRQKKSFWSKRLFDS